MLSPKNDTFGGDYLFSKFSAPNEDIYAMKDKIAEKIGGASETVKETLNNAVETVGEKLNIIANSENVYPENAEMNDFM